MYNHDNMKVIEQTCDSDSSDVTHVMQRKYLKTI